MINSSYSPFSVVIDAVFPLGAPVFCSCCSPGKITAISPKVMEDTYNDSGKLYFVPNCGDCNNNMSIDKAALQIFNEIKRSRLHPPMLNKFHAYGVILEEIGEFADSLQAQKVDPTELAQIAACCVVTLNDVVNRTGLSDVELACNIINDLRTAVGGFRSYHDTHARIKMLIDAFIGYENSYNLRSGSSLLMETMMLCYRALEFGVGEKEQVIECPQ